MEMEVDTEPTLNLSQEIQLMDILFQYFQDSQVKGTLSNLSKGSQMMDDEQGSN